MRRIIKKLNIKMSAVGNTAPNKGDKLNKGTKKVNARSNIKNDKPTMIPKNKLRPKPPLLALLNTKGIARINIKAVAMGFINFDQYTNSY